MNKTVVAVSIIFCFTVLVLFAVDYHTIRKPFFSKQIDYWEQSLKSHPDHITLICPPKRETELIDPRTCERQDFFRFELKHRTQNHKSQVYIMYASWFGALIALLGLILIWQTLRETRVASQQTKDATRAAWEATRVTKNIGRKQIKSYLGFADGNWSISGTTILFELSLKNFGNSPCISGNLICSFQVLRAHAFAPDAEPTISSPYRERNFGVIAANNVETFIFTWDTTEFCDINSQRLAAIKGSKTVFFVQFIYEDIFGDKTQHEIKIASKDITSQITTGNADYSETSLAATSIRKKDLA